MAGFFKKCQCLGKHDGQSRMAILELQHQGLEDIPSYYLIYDKALEELHLEANSFYKLPKFLGYFKNLKVLDISENELSSVSEVIGELHHLKCLNFSKNNIHEVDEAIQLCSKLEILNISVNPLTEIPIGLPNLTNMTEIYLNEIQLKQLPECFGNLNKLKILELRENNLTTLPKSLCMLVLLERLDIGNNHFNELPDVIGTLFSLNELWCDINELTTIPSFVGCLKSLVCLDASRNKINDISPDISGCVELTDLHLSFNYLKTIPDSFGCLSKLSILKIDSNQLITLPDKMAEPNAKSAPPFMESVTEFILTNNCLSTLPKWIGIMQNLRTLYLDENQLEELPNEIGSLKSLTILSCRSNNLTQVPDKIGDLNNLKILNLCDNKLSSLPCAILKLKNLSALWLVKNQTNPLVPLQNEYDPMAKKDVLTCILLPQKINDESEELPFEEINNTTIQSITNPVRVRNGHVKFSDKVTTFRGNCNNNKESSKTLPHIPGNENPNDLLKSILSNTNRKAPELIPTSSAYSIVTQTLYSSVSSDMGMRSSTPWYSRAHCRPSSAARKDFKLKANIDFKDKNIHCTSIQSKDTNLVPESINNPVWEQCHNLEPTNARWQSNPMTCRRSQADYMTADHATRHFSQDNVPVHTSNCIIYQLSGSSGYSSDGEIAKLLNGFAIQQVPCCSHCKTNGMTIISQGENGHCYVIPEADDALCAENNHPHNYVAKENQEIKTAKYDVKQPFIHHHIPFTDNEVYNSDSSLAVFDHKPLKSRKLSDRTLKYNIFRQRKKHTHPAITAILRGYHSDCEKSRLDLLYQTHMADTNHLNKHLCNHQKIDDKAMRASNDKSKGLHNDKEGLLNKKDVPFSWASKYLKIKKPPQDVLMDLNLKAMNKSNDSFPKDMKQCDIQHNKFKSVDARLSKLDAKMMASQCEQSRIDNKLDFVTFLGPSTQESHKCSKGSYAATGNGKMKNNTQASGPFYKTKLYDDIEFLPSKLQFDREQVKNYHKNDENCHCAQHSAAQFSDGDFKLLPDYASISQRHKSLSPNFPYESFDKLISAHDQRSQRHYSVPNTVINDNHNLAHYGVESQMMMPASSHHLRGCDLYCAKGKSGVDDRTNAVYGSCRQRPLVERNLAILSSHSECNNPKEVEIKHRARCQTKSDDSDRQKLGTQKNQTQATRLYEVILYKNNNELGFSIVGGKYKSHQGFKDTCPCHSHAKLNDNACDFQGIYVNKILSNGPAYNILQPRDLILAVNGKDFTTLTHEEAVAILKSTELAVKMKFARTLEI